MRLLMTIALAAVAMFFFASLFVPGFGWFGWKRTNRVLGFVSRAGLALIFGVPAFAIVVGAPFEGHRGTYVGLMILGVVTLVVGFIHDWGMADD